MRKTNRNWVLGILGAIVFTPAQATPDLANCFCLRCLMGKHELFISTSSHMKPTLEIDQCFVVESINAKISPPSPGDVIAFRHPITNVPHVSRVIAVAGQTVVLKSGQIWLDGGPVPVKPQPDYMQVFAPEGVGKHFPRCPTPVGLGTTCKISRNTETLPNGASYDVLDVFADNAADNTPEFLIPEGMLFLMGDNRDNSNDSRFSQRSGGVGFVPLENVIGVLEEIMPMTAPKPHEYE